MQHDSIEPKKENIKKKRKSDRVRCDICRRIITMNFIECRCGRKFCSKHIIFDMHDCTFDYKKLARDLIMKNNPVVKKQKIEKI